MQFSPKLKPKKAKPEEKSIKAMKIPMDMFLKRMTPPQEKTQKDPLEGIPEDGIIIIGNGSS